MGAFRHNIASVENCFAAICSVCRSGSKARWNEIKCFCIAIIKTLIFICYNVNRLICIRNGAGSKRYPKICFNIFCIYMLPEAAASCNLHVNELIAVVHFANKLFEQLFKLASLNRHIYVKKLCAVVKSV